MKKKQLSLHKKLCLNKEIISELNAQQQILIAGGALPPTRVVACISGAAATCATIPPRMDHCVFCATETGPL
jgi:hypothetical protein